MGVKKDRKMLFDALEKGSMLGQQREIDALMLIASGRQAPDARVAVSGRASAQTLDQ